MMLKLYHAPNSPCAQKVRLSLHEKKLDYEGVLVDLMRKENLQQTYLAINPNGVVPTLIDDGNTILESSIICEYLEDRFPEKPLRSGDAIGRARTRLWAKKVDDKIHPSSGVILFGAIVRRAFVNQTPEERVAMLARIPDPVRRERQADLLEHGLQSAALLPAIKVFMDMADAIEAATKTAPWMLGDTLSLVDFMLTPYVRILHNFELTRVFEERPALAAWFDRVQQTGGYQQGILGYEPPEDVIRRKAFLPMIKPKLEPLFV